MKTFRLLPCLGLGLLMAGPAFPDDSAPAPAAAPSAWTVGTAFNYSKGDYGFPTDTEVFSVPLNLGYQSGSWLLGASIPWIRITGPAANTGAGGAPRPNASAESGLGDIYASATYRFSDTLGPINLAFTGRIKFPTADEAKGLGTGETDYYGQFDFYHTFGSSTPFVSVGYRILGDNALYQLSDGMFASAGSHFRVSPETVWTVAANWGQRIIAGGDASTDVMLAFTHDLDTRWQVSGYALKGFTDASPDHGAGLQLNYRF
ncbi:MAG TPA: hypothetical protein VIM71_06865 [Lacunisphaera sp.]